jgi:hypothetical protein
MMIWKLLKLNLSVSTAVRLEDLIQIGSSITFNTHIDIVIYYYYYYHVCLQHSFWSIRASEDLSLCQVTGSGSCFDLLLPTKSAPTQFHVSHAKWTNEWTTSDQTMWMWPCVCQHLSSSIWYLKCGIQARAKAIQAHCPRCI